MLSTVRIVSPPAVEPVTLDQVRRHCRIDQTSEDDLLTGYAIAARAMVELYLSRSLITQTLLWTVTPENPLRPCWHEYRGTLSLPRAPVQSISAVTVLDALGNSTAVTLAALPIVPPAYLLGYKIDIAHEPARLLIGSETILVDGRTLCGVCLENVQIQFVAGYSLDGTGIPQPILNAILMTAAFLYENRGDAEAIMPRAAEWLCDPYRIRWV